MEEQLTNYENAIKELEDIVARVENNEMNIDDLTVELSRAQELIKFCYAKLTKTEEEVKKILSEENQFLSSKTQSSAEDTNSADNANNKDAVGGELPF